MTEKQENPVVVDRASEIVVQSNFKNDNINPRHKPQVLRIADDPVMQRAVNKIYNQGPRAFLTLFSALAEENMQALAVERVIKHFALLPDGALRALGSDQIKCFEPLEVPR